MSGVPLAEKGLQVEDQLLRHRPRLKKPPSGGSNYGAASASPPSRFERLTSLKPPALPGDIYLIIQDIFHSKPDDGRGAFGASPQGTVPHARAPRFVRTLRSLDRLGASVPA